MPYRKPSLPFVMDRRDGSRVAIARILVPIGFLVALLGPMGAGGSLLMGIAIALILGNPWPTETRSYGKTALSVSVVGLGAAADLRVVGRVGLHGIGYTAVGIGAAFLIGTLLGRAMKVQRDTSLLVTVGTAICGGSAIAAVAPVIEAKPEETSVSIATVFLLNAVALYIFPPIGHHLHLSESAFGMWCALAIHDTSSVVGAASQYGEHALEIATTAKLARALWIVPVTFAIGYLRARASKHEVGDDAKPARPWFIAGFVLAAAVVTYVPVLAPAGKWVALGARHLLAATLFLIGLGLSRASLKAIGVRPLVLAVALWLVLGSGTLAAIMTGLIE